MVRTRVALVVLLRGLNVGGHKAFRPKALAEQLGHLDIVNIGAAGTFVVRQPIGRAKLRQEIASRLPFAAEVVICEGRDIVRLVAHDPLGHYPTRREIVRFVSVLSRLPRFAVSLPIDMPSSDGWLLKILGREGRFVYGIHRRQMKVIGQLGALDKVFGVPATTRSWNTIAAIAVTLSLASPLSGAGATRA
jgi:uncharacterized protein (DUF1697 family)